MSGEEFEGQANLAYGQQEVPLPAVSGEYLQNHVLYGRTQICTREIQARIGEVQRLVDWREEDDSCDLLARWFKYSVMEALKRRYQEDQWPERIRANAGCRETAQGPSGRDVVTKHFFSRPVIRRWASVVFRFGPVIRRWASVVFRFGPVIRRWVAVGAPPNARGSLSGEGHLMVGQERPVQDLAFQRWNRTFTMLIPILEDYS
jgi:hypothetical protein